MRLRPVPLEKSNRSSSAASRRLPRNGRDVQAASEAGAQLIAHISGGRPGYAVRLIEDPSALAFRSEKLGDLQPLLSSTRVRKFSYAEKLAGDRDAFRNALLLWLSFWRDVLLRAGGAATPSANTDRSQEIDSLGEAPAAFPRVAALCPISSRRSSASMPMSTRPPGRDPAPGLAKGK